MEQQGLCMSLIELNRRLILNYSKKPRYIGLKTSWKWLYMKVDMQVIKRGIPRNTAVGNVNPVYSKESPV